ncbi:MAG: hypothetical protein WCK76_03335 [Elusimicrobiota bacterium]
MGYNAIFNTIYNILLVLASLAVAAAFPKYFMHVYKVGHSEIGKSFTVGVAACGAVWVLALVLSFMIPAGRQTMALMLLGFPLLLVCNSTGYALIAGLAGIDGGKHRFLAIILAGGATVAAEAFLPIGGRYISRGVFLYGIGACVLALQREMQEEDQEAGGAEGETQGEIKRSELDGDLSPLPRPVFKDKE